MSAQVCSPPAEIAATPLDMPGTVPGVLRPTVVPSPNCPKSFLPQQETPPLDKRAQVWSPPVDIAVTPLLRSTTSTGTLRFVFVPSPSSPQKLSPQQRTPPADVSAHECAPPALIPCAVMGMAVGVGVNVGVIVGVFVGEGV
jgi:hypothetical protein